MTIAVDKPVLKQQYTTIIFLISVFLLLFFRNPRLFIYPEPWAEDMVIFIPQEYNIGFPNTAFALYAGYIHLLPRIITWVSMKFDLANVMLIMNWTVLFFKVYTFYLIYKSKEITSTLIKFSLIAYLVLAPFADEIYNNVTNLQWWLIPLMAVLLLKHESNTYVLIFDTCLLVLAGLTGVNSIMFAVPCAYLLFKERNRDCFIKVTAILVCALIQFYCVSKAGRVSQIIYTWGGVADIIHMFVNRIVYHTLFNFHSKSDINILIFIIYVLILCFNIYYYRKKINNKFIFILIFIFVYIISITYNLYKTSKGHLPDYWVLYLSEERYFVIPRVFSFILFISSLNIVYRLTLNHRNYKRCIAYSCFLICLIILKNYPINFDFQYRYYDELKQFESAKPGEIVRFHFPPTIWHGQQDLRKK